MKQMTMSYTAKAAMAGGQNSPWNIAVIVDTTASMNDSDGGDQCSGTRNTCALLGVQALLNDLYPCGLGQTCTSSTTYVDSVSLFVFPAVTGTTAYKDSTCPTSNPTIVAYTFPDPPSNTTLPSADTYQVVGFKNNYKITDGATTLNQAAPIVIAAGDSGVGNCNGIGAPGGEGTYYAQVIYAAQAALLVQQAANPGSQNAIILLTDGDATACASNANTTAGACNTKSQLLASEGTLNGTGTKTSNPTGYQSYAYPSALGECGQAVLAAQAAANAGTTVYTIGYGSPTSGGCLTDKTYSASVSTGGGSWGPWRPALPGIGGNGIGPGELLFRRWLGLRGDDSEQPGADEIDSDLPCDCGQSEHAATDPQQYDIGQSGKRASGSSGRVRALPVPFLLQQKGRNRDQRNHPVARKCNFR